MKNINLNIDGVNVTVGEEVKAIDGQSIRLGTMTLRYISDGVHGLTVTSGKFTVVADLQNVKTLLARESVRATWEKNLRYEIGVSDEFRRHLAPAGVSDIFPVRLNPTNRLYRLGWKSDQVDMSKGKSIFNKA